MEEDESVALLCKHLDADIRAIRGDLDALAESLGHWPLLLDLVNGQLRELVTENALSLPEAMVEVEQSLDEEGLTAFDVEDETERRNAVERTITVSLRRLGEAEQRRYEMLAVFPEDVDVPINVVATLWQQSTGPTRTFCQRLAQLSLLQQYDARARTIRLHDVFRHYLMDRQGANMAGLRAHLLDRLYPTSGDWSELPAEEPYPWAACWILELLTDLGGRHWPVARPRPTVTAFTFSDDKAGRPLVSISWDFETVDIDRLIRRNPRALPADSLDHHALHYPRIPG